MATKYQEKHRRQRNSFGTETSTSLSLCHPHGKTLRSMMHGTPCFGMSWIRFDLGGIGGLCPPIVNRVECKSGSRSEPVFCTDRGRKRVSAYCLCQTRAGISSHSLFSGVLGGCSGPPSPRSEAELERGLGVRSPVFCTDRGRTRVSAYCLYQSTTRVSAYCLYQSTTLRSLERVFIAGGQRSGYRSAARNAW